MKNSLLNMDLTLVSVYWILLTFCSLISSEIVDSNEGDIVIRVKGGRSKVLASTNITLICQTTTNVGRIRWFQNGRRIAVTKRPKPNVCSLTRTARDYGYSCKGSRLTLVLAEVTSKDTGNWSCDDPQTKKDSNEVKINVITPTTEPPSSNLPSSVAIYGNKVTVVRGSTPLWLSCTSRCDSKFVFGWDYGNMTGNTSSVVRSEGTCSQSLTLWLGWQQDGGHVACTVRNPSTGKKVTESTTLDLEYMPLNPLINIDPPGPIQEGQEINITCRARPPGKPPGRNIIVVRAGFDKSYTSQSHVTFKVTREDDGSEIRCNAVSKHTNGNHSAYTSTKYLSVLYSPTLQVTSNYSMSEDGTQSVTFTCIAHGKPDNMTFSRWKHMNGSVVVRELEGDNTATRSVLHMTSLRYVDNGIYICNATNGIGLNGSLYKFYYASLVVKGIPYFPDNNDDVTVVTTFPNTSLTLTYRYVANPKAKATWFVNGQLLNSSMDGIQVGSSREKVKVNMYGMSTYKPGQEERLVFHSVTSDDDGDYYIRVCNEHGCRNSSILRVVISDDINVGEGILADEGSSNMAMIIGLSAGAAILIIVVIIVIALLVQRRKCGTHNTSDEKDEHTANGNSIVKGNPAYDRECFAENGRYHTGAGSEKESVMVIIKSSLYGKSSTPETRPEEREGTHEVDADELEEDLDLTERKPEENVNKEERAPSVSEETRKIVTEIYSQVQKPRSSQKGSTVSDDVTHDATDEKGADDAFHDVDLAEKTDNDVL